MSTNYWLPTRRPVMMKMVNTMISSRSTFPPALHSVSRTNYAGLFAVISTIYGEGDGSTTFNLPVMGGKGPKGYDANNAVIPYDELVDRTVNV